MIGLILIYFIGKSFYNLAMNFDKNKWGFAILGVVSYYVGQFIGGLVIGMVAVLANADFIFELHDLVLGLMALPFGILVCWGFHKLLKYQWSKSPIVNRDNLLDTDVMDGRDSFN